ncbi:MAG: FAD-binding protein [Bacillota bacterium]|nr:FAD-binding protein [Bacillota bacterium]
MKIQYKTQTDVLVIGSGGAGIKAAIKAAEAGVSVLLVSKHAFGRTGATFYPGTPGWGMQAVIHEGDSEAFFLEEILEAGAGMADPKLARILAEQSTAAFRELESYGLQFGKHEDGRYKGVIPCFGKRLRGSSTLGIDKIRRAMWLQLGKHDVTLRSGISVVALVKKEDQVCGAIAADEQNELFHIEAKAVVLATGGGCGIYRHALATPDETGDGYALALDAGASLVNIEFIQFIPGLVWPVQKKLFQEKNLDTLPQITNRLGENVVRKYLPPAYTVEQCLVERAKHGPFTTNDISFYVDVGMYEEAIAGNALPSGGIHVQYDRRVLTDDRWFIKSWLDWMHGMSVRPVEEGFDMIPHAQCFNGGIAIDEQACTGIVGLYAAGEVAGGPHGADRLGGAAIAATQVFGAIAGRESAAFAGSQAKHLAVDDSELDRIMEQRFAGQSDGIGVVDVDEAMREIRDTMWRCGAIVRSEERCLDGLSRVAAVAHSFSPIRQFESGTTIRRVIGLHSSIRLAWSLLTVMKERRESRGPHYRQDYPKPLDVFNCRLSLRQEIEGLSCSHMPLTVNNEKVK